MKPPEHYNKVDTDGPLHEWLPQWAPGHVRFEIGMKYHSTMYGADYLCVDRWFERGGNLEMVKLAELVKRTAANGGPDREAFKPFVRTARTMSHPVMDGVTDTRGGVTNHDLCDHYRGFTKSRTYGWICPLCGKSRWSK